MVTHRVWVLGGRMGIRWSSLQVTLKSSSWWHWQGGDAHPLPRRLLGRASSSVSCSRDPGLIFQETCATSWLRALSPHSLRPAPDAGEDRGAGGNGREEEGSKGL